MLNEFKTFIAKGNAVDMAVGIIIGAAFTSIVTSLVSDVINPVIGIFIGGIDFSNYYIDLSMGGYGSLAEAQKAGAPLIMYGLFINAIIRFLIVAFVVFLLVKNVNALKAKLVRAEAEAPAPPSQVEVLLAEIRDSLKNKIVHS
ncbi:MAG TPA: large conductance mechanosensitive channel protein MscL [Alphaproteobacteria bacterium]|nr:large conductance mechanosensitive channel protein MscL [Alphaproteobacteria bacterium]